MNKIARLSSKDREALFRNTTNKIGMTEAIVEKDFWVCWMLDFLFQRCRWKQHLAFKGGTSLSKASGFIKRFSEDIDLILDWRILGYGENEPWAERSKTKQDLFNKEVNQRAESFLKKEFLPELQNELSRELNISITLYIDVDNSQTINFVYPQSFTDSSILQEIRLEIGGLAAWTPTENKAITSYSAEVYPKLFEHPGTNVLTVLPERTFWEKVTILHREANRSQNKDFPARYSRHYYDLYCMFSFKAKIKAFEDLDLLKRVVAFKCKFYPCKWAKYEDAKVGTMKLVPPSFNLQTLEDDYEHMKNMIYGEKPSFKKVMSVIKKLETEINQR
jgi:hypothetical protein